MSIFEGAGVALVTPFHEDGSVNYEKLEQIVEEQIAGGTDCIIACGTTGEAATLSHEEHIEVIRFVCQVVNKRIPVVAGTVPTAQRQRYICLPKRKRQAQTDFCSYPRITINQPRRV